jgi:hypothetical protein
MEKEAEVAFAKKWKAAMQSVNGLLLIRAAEERALNAAVEALAGHVPRNCQN